MKKLLAIVILASLAYSGYWFFMAQMRENLLEEWLAERRTEGWVADVGALDVSGFPNRIDTFVKDLALADPDQGWRWDAEEFQILSMSWKPQHLIAVWPGEQVIGSPYETIRVGSQTLRGSVIFRPTPRLELDRSTIEIEALTLTGDLGWQAQIASALLATRQAPDTDPNAHEISFEAKGVVPPNAWTDEIPGSRALPRQMERLNLDAVITFDRPLDRIAVETENPAILAIGLEDASAVWGDLGLRAKGEVIQDSEGFAEGEISLRARNWRKMLDLAEEGEAITPDLAAAMRSGLDFIALLSGDRESIEVPLTFRNGSTYLGPIPIGAAPRLSRSQALP
ncbi:DUF2125 domain-containing protein [Amaricoccus macauensis]|uniref:DUF2125 domain-containing protein n=1 Tax=Amaricoccus macauensis TaxID=57001 RepID=UPI003C7CC1B8